MSKTVARRINTSATIGKNTYDGLLLVAAPFEMSDVQNNPSVILEKLASGIDDTIVDDLQNNPNFIFCTALKPSDVPDSDIIFKTCEYTPTEESVILLRVFGLVGIDKDNDSVADYVHHVSCQVSFVDDKVLFMTNKDEDEHEFDELNEN